MGGLTAGEAAGYVALLGVVFKFLLDAYSKWTAKAHEDARAEAERIAAREKTQRENETWLRGKVDEMVEHERAAYATTLAALNDRIETLEAWIKQVPPLVQELALAVARIDPAQTPTPTQMEALRSLFRQLRVDDGTADHVLFTKANP